MNKVAYNYTLYLAQMLYNLMCSEQEETEEMTETEETEELSNNCFNLCCCSHWDAERRNEEPPERHPDQCSAQLGRPAPP